MIKIALIENDISTISRLKNELPKHGYTVVGWAGDVQKAKALITETQPDLIILDYELNNNTKGSDVARFVKTHFGTPIVYMTQYDNPDILTDIGSTEYDVYLPKPFDMTQFLLSIKPICRRIAEKPAPQLVKFVSNGETISLPVGSILWIESELNGNGIWITTTDTHRKYRIYMRLNKFLEQNPLSCLYRISSHQIVNLSHVAEIQKTGLA